MPKQAQILTDYEFSQQTSCKKQVSRSITIQVKKRVKNEIKSGENNHKDGKNNEKAKKILQI